MVADALVKTLFGREPVTTGVFTNDQHRPSVLYAEPEQASDGSPTLGSGADQSSTPSDPEVMELDDDLGIEPDPLED